MVYVVGRARRSRTARTTAAAQLGRRTYSSSEILEAIHRWVELYGAPPLSVDWDLGRATRRGEVERVARLAQGEWPSARMVARAFGIFNRAIVTAGYTPRTRPARSAARLAGPDEILHAIQAWPARHGEPPTMADWGTYRVRRLGQDWRVERYRDGDWPSVRNVCTHFGTLGAAIRAAGLEPRAPGTRAMPRTAARQAHLRAILEQRARECSTPDPARLLSARSRRSSAPAEHGIHCCCGVHSSSWRRPPSPGRTCSPVRRPMPRGHRPHRRMLGDQA